MLCSSQIFISSHNFWQQSPHSTVAGDRLKIRQREVYESYLMPGKAGYRMLVAEKGNLKFSCLGSWIIQELFRETLQCSRWANLTLTLNSVVKAKFVVHVFFLHLYFSLWKSSAILIVAKSALLILTNYYNVLMNSCNVKWQFWTAKCIFL